MTAAWYARMEVESQNLSSALAWTLDERRDTVLGQRLVAAMRPVWTLVGGGERWLGIARELADHHTPPLLAARVELAAAWAASFAGDSRAALALSRPLVAVFEALGDEPRAANAQGLAAFSLLFLGRPEEAEPLIAAALEVARSYGRESLVAFVLRGGSLASSLRGDLSGSRAKLVEALAICERTGADRLATIVSGQLAELEFQAGNVEQAFELAARSLNLQRAQRSRHITQALANIAAYSIALDRWDRARAYAREALGLAQGAQDTMALTVALQHLAAVAVLSRNGGSSPCRVAPTAAVLVLGHVDACALRLGVTREYTEQQGYDRVLVALQASDLAVDLAPLLAQGATLASEEAIELALSL